uniref:Uncharacterized protein n=1 Tax=Fagus sylvatica TaxID=28930 RepID=A0A2N9I727_FAGSY
MLQSLNPRAALPLGSFSQTGLEESRGGGAAVWRGSRGGGVDSVGLAVELTAWVSRWI